MTQALLACEFTMYWIVFLLLSLLLCAGPLKHDFFLCCLAPLDKIEVSIDITCPNGEPKHAQDADDRKEDALWEVRDRVVESGVDVQENH